MKNSRRLILGLLAMCCALSCSLATPLKITPVKAPTLKKIPIVKLPEAENVGGLGPVQQPNDVVRGHVTKLDKDIKDKVCVKSGGKPGEGDCKVDHKLTVLAFKTQTVAGTNYFVKVKCDTGKVWHVRIYERSWENILQLDGVDGPKTEADEIVYFEQNK